MKKIYLDHAASTPLHPEVLEQMKPYLLEHFGNPSSTHGHGRVLRAAIETARKTIANCIGAKASEIYFTSGGSEADNMILKGAVEKLGVKHIISTEIEHHAVTHTIEALAAMGKITYTYLQVDELGHIDLAELEAVLKKHPNSLVSLMHANNEIGTLHDIESIGKLAKQYEAYFHSDTVQSIGCWRYNMATGPLDFAVASAHKFNGPKGIGFAYIRKGIAMDSLIHGGGQEMKKRAGTEDVASIVGMAYAFEKCCKQLDVKREKLLEIKDYMRGKLKETFKGVSFNGDPDPTKSLPTVLNASIPCGEKDAMLTFQLDLAGISCSGGSACNSGANQGSHVLRALGVKSFKNLNSIRFSFCTSNTQEEIDFVLEKLSFIVHEPVM